MDKAKRKVSDAQREGLKKGMWKPGQSGNPEGGRAHDPIKKEFRKFTSAYLKEIIELAVMGDTTSLARIAEDPSEPAIKVGLARSVFNAVNKGDWPMLERIFERITGRVPIVMEHAGKDGGPITTKELSDEDLAKKVAEEEAKLKQLD